MPFNTALSGLRAASKDLSITGNNIANASTTGFKSSRGEFGDVYSTSVVGAGNNSVGSGVKLQRVAQQFTQGGVTFTENELDMAINGNGFFVVNRNGEQLYTRAGTFSLDKDGYVVNNANARLRGLSADNAGNISGLQSDLRIQVEHLEPRSTTGVQSQLNLDSASRVLQSNGLRFSTEGNAVSVPQAGIRASTSTNIASLPSFTLPLGIDFTNESVSFDLELTASSGNNGTVSVNLDSARGLPANINTFNDLRTLAGVINGQIFAPLPPQMPVDVIAEAVDLGGGNYRLQFTSLEAGEASQIRLLNSSPGADELGLPTGGGVAVSTPGVASVTNGYPAQSLQLTDDKGNTVTFTSAAGASAATTASQLNAMVGVSATASTEVRLPLAGYANTAGNLAVTVNGVTLVQPNLPSLGNAINGLTGTTLPGISAEVDGATGDLVIRSSVGDDISIAINSVNDGDALQVIGNPGAPAVTLEVDSNGVLNNPSAMPAQGNKVVVGGTMEITLEEGYSAANPLPPSIGLFGPLTNNSFTDVVINAFDPADQATYNSATSMTIYDSLGNPHVLTQFFVKQEYDRADPTTAPNHWVMYVQVDGRDVGDPDTNLPPPANTLPTRASFNVYFNEDGSLDTVHSDSMLISNWQPLDENGNPNGSMGPQHVLAGATSNIPDPPISSNFVIDMNGSTQVGSTFAVNDVDQNGYTTGRLSGLNVDESGIIFARFTNGESQILGQVLLAHFANTQGLQPAGDTMWSENYQSGPPNIGAPGSAALGTIQAGALEDSNVDLSEELVALIVAQRNFQASAKTIETADQVTQTILNIR